MRAASRSGGWPAATIVSLTVGAAAVVVLFWRFGLEELSMTLRRAHPLVLLLVFVVGALVRLGYSLRWRACARALGGDAPLSRFLQARLAGDAVGAVLPTGRISGDPLRIALLHNVGEKAAIPTAAVVLDRFMEWVGNSFCALGCVWIFVWSRAATNGESTWLVVSTIGLLGSLIAPLTMLRWGWRPFQPLHLLRAYVASTRLDRWLRLLYETETQLLEVFRCYPRVFVVGVLASLLIELVILIEYRLLLSAFGIVLAWPILMMAVVTGGLARAVPVPGGLGVFEASEVGLMAVATGDPALGFVVGIVMRLHEAFWMLTGFVALAKRGGVDRLRFLVTAGKAAV